MLMIPPFLSNRLTDGGEVDASIESIYNSRVIVKESSFVPIAETSLQNEEL
jgi:hypothetical protein